MSERGVNLLKQLIKESKFSYEDFAAELSMDRSTFYRKLATCGNEFSIKEANTIKRLLELTEEEALIIFFDDVIA